MEINVLNSDLQKIAIIDNYTSLIWSRRYYDIGALDLEIDATNENISIFRKGNYITRNNDDGVYIIKALEIDTKENGDNHLIVGAYEIKELLQRRIIWNTVVFSGTAENYIRKLITDNVINPTSQARRISNFNLKSAKGYSEGIDQQVSYDNLADKIIEVCTTYGYGWKVTLENGRFYFDLYKGVDHTVDQDENVRLLFSPDNENIISTKYKTDDSNFKNVALVGGEGEGVDRKKRTIGSAAGLERFETFIDASGLSTNTEEGDLVDYYNALIAEGKEKLSEQAVVSSFEGEVDLNQYKYKVDYNLGDIVTVRNEFGIQANARITEVIETWDDEGYTVEPKFEYYEPIDFEVPVEGALLTENRMMLLSESGGTPITTEDATNGIKISELDELLAVDDGCCLPVVHGTGTRKVRLGTIFDKIRSWLGNGTLTIKRNGVLVNTFAANQSSNAEVNIEVPTKTSQLTNDSNFIMGSNHGTFAICSKDDGGTTPFYFLVAKTLVSSQAGNIDALEIEGAAWGGVSDPPKHYHALIRTRTNISVTQIGSTPIHLDFYSSGGMINVYVKLTSSYERATLTIKGTSAVTVYGGALPNVTPSGTFITSV